MCIYVYIHTYIYIYIYIHTHIHIIADVYIYMNVYISSSLMHVSNFIVAQERGMSSKGSAGYFVTAAALAMSAVATAVVDISWCYFTVLYVNSAIVVLRCDTFYAVTIIFRYRKTT